MNRIFFLNFLNLLNQRILPGPRLFMVLPKMFFYVVVCLMILSNYLQYFYFIFNRITCNIWRGVCRHRGLPTLVKVRRSLLRKWWGATFSSLLCTFSSIIFKEIEKDALLSFLFFLRHFQWPIIWSNSKNWIPIIFTLKMNSFYSFLCWETGQKKKIETS